MTITLDTGQILTALATVASAVAGSVWSARKLVRPLLGMAKEWRELRGDWYGVPDREGFPGHKGMGVRMRDVEIDVKDIKAELTTNGGSSLKDTLNRIEAQGRVSAIHSNAPLVTMPLPNHSEEAA